MVSILATTGCKSLFPDRRMVEPQRVKNFRVEFEHEVSAFEEEFALFSVDYTIKEWEKDHGSLPPGWTIRISSYSSVYWGKEELPFPPWSDDPWFTITSAGKKALGWCIPSKRLVYITLGRWSNLPALYHEFCHVALAPNDPDHKDPRWPKWRSKCRELEWSLQDIWWDRWTWPRWTEQD